MFIAISIGCALIITFPLVFFFWMHSSRLQQKDADALIILGYRCDHGQIHPHLRDRLDTAVRLISRHKFQYVILSGGAVASSKSEAEIMRDYLIHHGIGEERIILEQASRNTVHNVVNCSTLMEQHGLTTCLLVSNSFHIRRMKYIMRELGIPASFYASRGFTQLYSQWSMTFQEIRAFRLTLPWIKKAMNRIPGEMMGKPYGKRGIS